MRIQQNYPATNFKAQLEIFNAEPKLQPIIDKNKWQWEHLARRIGRDEDKLCLTIAPHDTRYAINGSVGTTIGVNLFSSFAHLFEGSLLKYPGELPRSPENCDFLSENLEGCVQDLFYNMNRPTERASWK